MIQIAIPGFGRLEIAHLVLDFNGTLAVDGQLVPGVTQLLSDLGRELTVHVITADTFGTARSQLEGVACRFAALPPGAQDLAKDRYVQQLGAAKTACIGNGRNDRRMLRSAALGIAVMLAEGTAVETLLAADIVSTDIRDALALLTHPLRLTATLRS
jgi:soluble P-type ATPase